MTDSDEWTSDIVSRVQHIVKKALTEERVAIIDLIKKQLGGEYGYFEIDELVSAIQERKLDFKGVQI